MQIEEDYQGIQPHKKVKMDPTFYLFGKKIIAFGKFDQLSDLNLFLTDIAESISKPAHTSQYQINQTSLLRAKSLGYTAEKVLVFLHKHSKNTVGQDVIEFVKGVMQTQPATRLYLVQESGKNYYVFEHKPGFVMQQDISELLQRQIPNNNSQSLSQQGENMGQINTVVRWEVRYLRHNELFKRLFDKKIPVLSQKVLEKKQLTQELKTAGDMFRNKALHCKNLKISLKAFTKLRDYQAEALKAVVYHSTETDKKIAKSGYIVLPCGAGKTLLGIAICAKVRKEALIVCSSDSGAEQWKRQIQKWTQGINRDQIIILTAKTDFKYTFKPKDGPRIYVTTYSNLKAKLEGRDNKETKVEHEWLKKMPWGLIVFDEAQWLPAPGNSLIANSLMAHVKVGLTATPLRQDQNIKSLIYMIGPRLYEGSWRKFVENGYLANPKCVEIRTKLTSTFQYFFEVAQGEKAQEAIFECNPNKIKTLLLLLQYHEEMNDQIIVFCDRISVIRFLAKSLKRPLLTGDTEINDRNFVFDMFRQGKYKTLFLSRIGDEAIDLPNATVGIEINIHKGSRRQMLQRLGRIMRPKDCNVSSSYNAMFYTIVTDSTQEIKYFNKRRECLINLGFQYDLKFSSYGEEAISDILGEPNNEYVNRALKKYSQVMDLGEHNYWDLMRGED